MDVLGPGWTRKLPKLLPTGRFGPNEEENRHFAAELEKGADAILFFSPSAVHHLQELLGAAKFVIMSRVVAFTAIGPVTEKSLRARGVERVISAKDTHAAAVLAALSDFFALRTELACRSKTRMSFPINRPRRLRRTEALRGVVRETRLSTAGFIYPMFVCPGSKVKNEVSSMPGVYQQSADQIVEECREVESSGYSGDHPVRLAGCQRPARHKFSGH